MLIYVEVGEFKSLLPKGTWIFSLMKVEESFPTSSDIVQHDFTMYPQEAMMLAKINALVIDKLPVHDQSDLLLN